MTTTRPVELPPQRSDTQYLSASWVNHCLEWVDYLNHPPMLLVECGVPSAYGMHAAGGGYEGQSTPIHGHIDDITIQQQPANGWVTTADVELVDRFTVPEDGLYFVSLGVDGAQLYKGASVEGMYIDIELLVDGKIVAGRTRPVMAAFGTDITGGDPGEDAGGGTCGMILDLVKGQVITGNIVRGIYSNATYTTAESQGAAWRIFAIRLADRPSYTTPSTLPSISAPGAVFDASDVNEIPDVIEYMMKRPTFKVQHGAIESGFDTPTGTYTDVTFASNTSQLVWDTESFADQGSAEAFYGTDTVGIYLVCIQAEFENPPLAYTEGAGDPTGTWGVQGEVNGVAGVHARDHIGLSFDCDTSWARPPRTNAVFLAESTDTVNSLVAMTVTEAAEDIRTRVTFSAVWLTSDSASTNTPDNITDRGEVTELFGTSTGTPTYDELRLAVDALLNTSGAVWDGSKTGSPVGLSFAWRGVNWSTDLSATADWQSDTENGTIHDRGIPALYDGIHLVTAYVNSVNHPGWRLSHWQSASGDYDAVGRNFSTTQNTNATFDNNFSCGVAAFDMIDGDRVQVEGATVAAMGDIDDARIGMQRMGAFRP